MVNSATRSGSGGFWEWMTMFIPAGMTCSIVATMVASGCRGQGTVLHRVPADLQSISSALRTYAINGGRLPTTDQGLAALVTQPTTGPLPEDWVKIMSRAPMDPWKQPYHYRLLSEADGTFRWELRSAGPDGIAGNEDDLAEESEWRVR